MTPVSPDDLDLLAAQMAATVAPALVTAVHHDDARMVEQLLSGLDRQRLYALAVVLAAQSPQVEPRRREQTRRAARLEDYLWCRQTGASIEEAAIRVGIRPGVARKHFEPYLKEITAA